jgi:hypothetical protein
MQSEGRQFTDAGLNFSGPRELTVSRTCGPVQAQLTGGLFVPLGTGPRGLALVSYGAEIASPIADDCFAWLDASVRRIGSTDPFVGYAPRSRGTS